MLCKIRNVRSYFAATDGIAAIETAMLLPVLMLLYVGTIDLTDLITHNRKITQATDIVASLVAENQNTVTLDKAQDYFNAVDMVMSATGVTNAKADIKAYRKVITNASTGAFTINKIWTATKSSGGCNINPTADTLGKLAAQGNDVIVASVCQDYAPIVANILGNNILGKTTFVLSEQIAVRPRVSNQLSCKMSDTNTAACPVS